MTLKEFFDLLAENPYYIFAFFTLIPVTALIAGFLGKNEGHLSPWKYLYSALIYLICVPGIFALTLSVYLFLFERRSIFETDMYTQVFPVISMIITLLLIRNNVSLDRIPGFGKMSGLITMISTVMILMWFLEKTRIYVFSYLRIEYLLVIFVVLLIIFRLGWSKILSPSK